MFATWVRTSCLFLAAYYSTECLHRTVLWHWPWVGAAVVPLLWFHPERQAPRWEITHLCSPALTPVPGEFSVSARRRIDALEGGSYLLITQTPLKRVIPGVPFFPAFESGLLVPLEL